jgi:dihydropteroate synthase
VIFGILNVTPDSFSDGGDFVDHETASDHAVKLMAHGASIIDVGGESTRPGATVVDAETEMARVLPVIGRLTAIGIPTSVDTMKYEVAAAALEVGAEVVNDVSGFRDPEMRAVVARSGGGAVLMHMPGTPSTMQDLAVYDDVVAEVAHYLREGMAACTAAGIEPESLCVDPGIGFGKDLEHNLQLIARLDELVDLGRPIMVGASRKRFLGSLLDLEDPMHRDGATAVVTALAYERGATVFRVHDVGESARAVRLAQAILGAARPQPWT